MAKQDYSRLLDDEFLNAGERVRVRVVNSSASRILSVWGRSPSPTAIQIGLLVAVLLGAVLTLIVYLSAPPGMYVIYSPKEKSTASAETARLVAFSPVSGVHPTQRLPVPPAAPPVAPPAVHPHPLAGLSRDEASLIRLAQSPRVLKQLKNLDIPRLLGAASRSLQSSVTPAHVTDVESRGDEDHADHLHEPRTNSSESSDHQVALAGGFSSAADADEHHHLGVDGDHIHVNDGDVVLEDHHIVSADAAGSALPALLLCLPVPGRANATSSDPTPPPASNASTLLPRAQQDVAHSVMEYLGEAFSCHVVILEGARVASSTDQSSSEAPATAAPVTQSPVSAQSSVTEQASTATTSVKSLGCHNASILVDVETQMAAGLAHSDHLILADGKRVGVVHWSTEQFFSQSPFSECWHALEHMRVSDSHQGADLLSLTARLLLLWRYGGITVDLGASTDQVLKALSMVNRSDTNHTYLETTHATLIAAPQTCNAVIFDLINAVLDVTTTQSTKNNTSTTDLHTHHSDGDVRVFDALLDEYCRHHDGSRHRKQRRWRAPQLGAEQHAASLLKGHDPDGTRVDRTVCRGELIALTFV